MTQKLYPLKFHPIFKEKIWGGSKLKTKLNKDFSPLPNCGETWELSGVKENVSIVKEGNLAGNSLEELITIFKDRLVGKSIYDKYHKEFPLLIKFIDANDDLSIQVHPDDKLAKQRHKCLGKTEMWYVIQADKDAKLISGFNKKITKEEYIDLFNNKNLSTVLNYEKVNANDVFFIPAGRIHTIGKGILLAEIQQTSDITYRIYDWNRKDTDGNLRDLHTNEALDAIDYNFYGQYKLNYNTVLNEVTPILAEKYFTTNKIYIDKKKHRNYYGIDSFVIYIGLEGDIKLKYADGSISLTKGDVVLIPAEIKDVELDPIKESKILEVYV